MGATRRFGLVLLTAGMLAGSLALTTGPSAVGATPPCRVRNVTQDTFGRSLIRLVERARDGDRLRVRGICAGEITIPVDVSIRGLKGAVLTGRGEGRVVRVTKGSAVTLRRLIIRRGGYARGGGAGIRNAGDLTLVATTVRRNSARKSLPNGSVKGSGAGITNEGTLTLIDSIVSANAGAFVGGAVFNEGTLTLIDSIVRGNSADAGGGIFNVGSATLIRSRVTRNKARIIGGGISNGDSVFGDPFGAVLDLTDSRVSGNEARSEGGGIWNDQQDATVTLDIASSVTDNTPDDCVGTSAC